jgi:hypothetical protein
VVDIAVSGAGMKSSGGRVSSLRFFVVFFSPSRQMLGQYFEIGHYHFIMFSFFISCIYYLNISWYIMYVVEKALFNKGMHNQSLEAVILN